MIDLTHVGEILVAELFQRNKKIAEQLRIPPGEAFPEIDLHIRAAGNMRFDGMSRIDVGVFHNDICYPIELKLGLTSMGNNQSGIGRFTQPYHYNDNESRICGSMIAVLSGQKAATCHCKLEDCFVRHPNQKTKECSIFPHWILIVRTANIAGKLRENTDVFSPEKFHCTIFSFEELFSRDDVNAIMKAQLREKDFYNDWFGKK